MKHALYIVALLGGALGSFLIGCDSNAPEADPLASLAIASPLGEQANFMLPQGQSTQLNLTATTASGQPVANPAVTWTSSNASVVSVTTTGVIRGVATGTATVSVSAEGQMDERTIEVFDLTGTWEGTADFSSVALGTALMPGLLRLELTQNGTDVTGTFYHEPWNNALGGIAGRGPVTGSLNWNRFNNTSDVAMGCLWTMSSTFEVIRAEGVLQLAGVGPTWEVRPSCGGVTLFTLPMPATLRRI